ncbi:structural maintenance of chromosomes protein 4 [Nephila pilipes]|uniref:Structural maintenance of chromosomes protein n=1 Tax=Nephila pilipes TaxID=299642 RepID=A0A8X6IUZ3_NEPPI|nr:structural maintenance of chromosomes protein 4 [Nephila pilipes]
MEEISDQSGVKTDFIVQPNGSITADEITVPPAPAPALTTEATKERLIISELHVRDFKSYAGSRLIGPFDKNFSCIVGPNGSGKSNVIDALLFVFGYRAQKIRSKKVSVLIHKSNKYPDLDSCSVTVKFATIKDEGESFTILPNSQFSVTRTGYNDNSSTYEIDGRRCQYKEVANLLKKYGIDLDFNRFMILQGEIELISMMKPKAASDQETGMLEYIEDIIGSNRFIKPIAHFDIKAEEANERRIEKLNQLKIVEKERADAEKPRAKALEYLRLVNKLALLENSALQAQIKVATREGEQLSLDKNTLSEKIDSLSSSFDQLQSTKQIKDEELKAISSECDSCAKTVDDFKQEFVALERADAACRENLKSNKEKCKKLTKSLETEETKMLYIRKQPDILLGEISELEEKKAKLEATKAEEEEKLTEIMGTVKEEIQEFQEEKDKYEEELINLKSVVNDKKSELDLAQSELDLLLSSEKKEQDKLNELETEYKKTISLIKEEEMSLKKANERIPELKLKILSSEKDLTEKEKKEIVLIEELKNKRIKLDEAKSSLNASQDRHTLVKVFMEQKRKGKLTGVYGRLGDLGGIDAKYDVAISTACGALDHIVTDTISTAQECVELLKKDNLGYATFIALDQMKKWEPYVKEKISTPESVPRLFDLITVKDKNVLPAFYFALGNTLVANDLDQATRVGLKGSSRHRVVTLKGELIDLSGTMSGGGGRCLKGRMGQTVMDNSFSQKEIDKLTEEIENFNNELIEIKKYKAELKNTIENSNKELAALQHSLKKSKLNYEGFKEREKMLSQQIELQKKKVISVAPDKEQISEIQSKIKHHEKNHNIATSGALKIENTVKELQEQIMSITKGKYGTAQKKLDKLTKEINQVSQNITKNTAILKNTDKNLKKAEAKIDSIKAELEACKNSIETLKEEFEDLGGRGLEVANKKKEAEDALMLYQVQKASTAGEIKELSSKMHEIKSEMIEHKNKVKLIDVDIRANQSQIKTLNSRLSKLELHDIEEGPTELPTLADEEICDISLNSIQCEIGDVQNQMQGMNPDLGAIAEFKRKEEIYKKKLKDFEETVLERDHYRNHYENLRKHRLDEFMRGFNIITLKVKELYQMLTLGGDAELELVDSLNPFSEGVDFCVRPLRKSWKSIRNLSGGEKTLSSLSLVFALHYYRSTPFFVMDEIDAALDFKNVSIIGSYIKDCTKNAQFIVISLRENMFMLADHLVGIYKTKNITKNVYFIPPPEEVNRNREENEDSRFDKLKTIEPIPYQNKSTNSNILNETLIKKVDGNNCNDPVDFSKELSVDQGNVTSKDVSFFIGEMKDKETIEKEENEVPSIKNEGKMDKENLRLSTRSTRSKLKTPKRKINEVDDSVWSEDDDFVISTPTPRQQKSNK